MFGTSSAVAGDLVLPRAAKLGDPGDTAGAALSRVIVLSLYLDIWQDDAKACR